MVKENKDCLVTVNNLSGKVYKVSLNKIYEDGSDEGEKEYMHLFYLKNTKKWDSYKSLREIKD